LLQSLVKKAAVVEVVSLRQGQLTAANGSPVVAEHTVLTMPSVMYDAVYVPGGPGSVEALAANGDAIHYVAEAYKHCKAIAADAAGEALLAAAGIAVDTEEPPPGVLIARSAGESRELPARLAQALAQHRFFEREDVILIPA
jgi:catalase